MNKKIAFKVGVSVVLTLFLISRIDFADFLSVVKNTNIAMLLLVYSSFIFGTSLCVYKWQMLLSAHGINKPSIFRLFSLYLIGIFFSNFLPTEVGGDVVRAYEVGKISGKKTEAFASVLVERITGFVAVILYVCVGVILNWEIIVGLPITYVLIVTSLFLMICLVLFSMRRFARRIKKLVSFPFFAKVLAKLQSLYEAFYLYRSKFKIIFVSMILSVLFQLFAIWYLYAIAYCFDLVIPFRCFVLLLPAVTIISLLPISINAIGIREGAFIYLLALFSIGNEQALALALLYRVGIFIPGIVGGFLHMHDVATEKYYKTENEGRHEK
jgi:uncharacterized protein (TIRG00374 family)